MTLRFRRWWIAAGWLAVAAVIVGSLVRVPSVVDLSDGRDKVVHLLAYFALAAWFGQIYRRWPTRWLYGFAFITLGLLLEWAQGSTLWRGADRIDALANTAGVLLALALLATPFQDWLGRFDRRLATMRAAAARRST